MVVNAEQESGLDEAHATIAAEYDRETGKIQTIRVNPDLQAARNIPETPTNTIDSLQKLMRTVGQLDQTRLSINRDFFAYSWTFNDEHLEQARDMIDAQLTTMYAENPRWKRFAVETLGKSMFYQFIAQKLADKRISTEDPNFLGMIAEGWNITLGQLDQRGSQPSIKLETNMDGRGIDVTASIYKFDSPELLPQKRYIAVAPVTNNHSFEGTFMHPDGYSVTISTLETGDLQIVSSKENQILSTGIIPAKIDIQALEDIAFDENRNIDEIRSNGIVTTSMEFVSPGK